MRKEIFQIDSESILNELICDPSDSTEKSKYRLIIVLIRILKKKPKKASFFSLRNNDFLSLVKSTYTKMQKDISGLAGLNFDVKKFKQSEINALIWDLLYYSRVKTTSSETENANTRFVILLNQEFLLTYEKAGGKSHQIEDVFKDAKWSVVKGISLSKAEYDRYERNRDLTIHSERRSIDNYTREYEIDKLRVFLADDFRRLAEVTQVISPDNNYVFHNRLTHSLEVAQIGRKIAERFLRTEAWNNDVDAKDKSGIAREVFMYENRWASRIQTEVALYRFLDPDVVEIAGLLHDIGHPPFGHVCESELQRLGNHVLKFFCPKALDFDAFEGNAQTFRIVTNLAAQQSENGDFEGLKLTTASLHAIIKYPWYFGYEDAAISYNSKKKFNIYSTIIPTKQSSGTIETTYFDDQKIFQSLTGKSGWNRTTRTLEAEIMNYADDVAYSIQDIYDFYKAGIFDLDRILELNFDEDFDKFWELKTGAKSNLEKFWSVKRTNDAIKESQKENLRELIWLMSLGQQYQGSSNQRADVKRRVDFLITWFISQVKLDLSAWTTDLFDTQTQKLLAGKKLPYPDVLRTLDSYIQIEFLMFIFRKYFLDSHKLATKQIGIKNIVKDVFFAYFSATSSVMGTYFKPIEEAKLCSGSRVDFSHFQSQEKILPPRFYEVLTGLKEKLKTRKSPPTLEQLVKLRIRLTNDAICSLSDTQAISVHKRLMGLESNEFIENSDLTKS